MPCLIYEAECRSSYSVAHTLLQRRNERMPHLPGIVIVTLGIKRNGVLLADEALRVLLLV